MNRTTKQAALIALALGAFLPACAGDPPTSLKTADRDGSGNIVGDTIDKAGNQPEDSVGNEDTTYDHMPGLGEDDSRDPVAIAKQREEEGTPFQRAKMHSCQKMQITSIRNILSDFGVDLGATSTPPSAGQLLDGGGTALGQANYAARMGEDIVWTAAGAAKTFDIFVQAAPAIIASLPNAPQCQVDGVGPAVFAEDGTCNVDAVSCLIGRPATAEHIAICNSVVASASTPENGQNIAVATLLAAAHSCE